MFINIQQFNATAFPPGTFLLPAIDYLMVDIDHVALSDDKRLHKSIMGMKSILTRSKLDHISDLMPDDSEDSLPTQLDLLSEKIACEIREYDTHQLDSELINIFHMIQFWGGIGGRSIYVKGAGFENNFDSQAYRKFASTSRAKALLPQKISQLSTLSQEIRFFGVAFATKHAKFWSEDLGADSLLIYDSIMSEGCMGYPLPAWRHYLKFLTEMQSHAKELSVTPKKLERLIFNFLTSPDGKNWIQARISQAQSL
jgi:hypothetical protein